MIPQTSIEKNLAVAGVLFSSAMWGIIWYPLRLLEHAGMSAVWSVLVMYLAAALLVTPFWYKNRSEPINLDLIWLAIAAGVTNLAFVVALIEGEIMRVMLLFYLSPLWSVLLSRLWLGEKLSHSAIVMFIVAMCGSIIMLWNPQIGWPWPHGWGDWLAIIAGIAFSFNNVLARKLATVSMVLKTTVIWWGVVIISILVLVLMQTEVPDVSTSVWGAATLMGCLGIASMNITVLYGIARMPIYRSAVIMLFELVVAALSAWYLINEVMSLQEWIGGALILFAGYGVVRFDKSND